MSDADDAADADDIDAIRERKKERLRAQAETDGESGDADESDDAGESDDPNDPVHVDGEDHLSALVADNDVVLVDFYADWCGPCQMLEPTVEAVAAETSALVAKVDVDRHQHLAREYQVQGVPTLFLFADGESVERLVGMQDRETLFALVRQYL